MTLSPETVFYLRIILAGVIVAALAVKWDRWYIKRMLTKEFVVQLKREARLAQVRQSEGATESDDFEGKR